MATSGLEPPKKKSKNTKKGSSTSTTAASASLLRPNQKGHKRPHIYRRQLPGPGSNASKAARRVHEHLTNPHTQKPAEILDSILPSWAGMLLSLRRMQTQTHFFCLVAIVFVFSSIKASGNRLIVTDESDPTHARTVFRPSPLPPDMWRSLPCHRRDFPSFFSFPN